ncbi:MAG: U32 family peptidase [Candidatus Hodarchaeota archaeon]
MRISLACNWKHNLLDQIEAHPEIKNTVHDLYGAYDMTFTGSGRPFFLMAKREKDEIESFINRVHDMGLQFTWLWNGECLGYYKFNAEEQAKALKELDWLDDIGVEYITVSDPYLAEFVKEYHPRLKIKVSVISEVNSLSRAMEWGNIIGDKGVLTLSIMTNRNFPLLEEIRENVKCDIELLTNDCCLNECPFRFFHYTECSHASQPHDTLKGYYNDWATIACQNQKCMNPEQVLMCKWIQPDDLDKYINIGLDYFKISGRRYGTKWLFQVLKAYSDKHYEGDLGKIFNGYSFESDPLQLAGAQFSELAARQEEMGGYPSDAVVMLSVPEFRVQLNSTELKDFIDQFPFKGARCAENCGVTCFYCYKQVDKAYTITDKESLDSYKDYMKYLLNYLNYTEMTIPEEKRKFKSPVIKQDSNSFSGTPWNPDVWDLFNETLEIVPKEFQFAAKNGIGYTAEKSAQKIDSKEVDTDIFVSVLLQVVPAPFKHDVHDFLIEKNIDPKKYLKSDEIEEILKIPYGTEMMEEKARQRGVVIEKAQETTSTTKISIETKKEWEAYLTDYMATYNELEETPPLFASLAPLLFQYKITDRPEMDYWQNITPTKMEWGMGDFSGPEVPTITHKTNFETIKKVNSGESNPIEATMAGTYIVEGDVSKLMGCVPLVALNAKVHDITQEKKKKEVKTKMNTKEEWEAYMTKYMKAYNELPDLANLLAPIAPLVFQYKITDRPEMSYWQNITPTMMDWGMGEYSGPEAPMIIHKTDFDTMQKVNSGESDPIQATMAGTYVVEGDVTKLMSCATLLPLNAKAHAKTLE